MAAQNQEQKFFEIIKPGSNYEFIGRQKYWIGLSIVLVTLTVVMLPLNAYVFKARGHMLNWGVDFRGGSEILIEFSQAGRGGRDPQDAGRRRLPRRRRGQVRRPDRQEAVELHGPRRAPCRSSPSSRPSRSSESLAKEGDASLKRFEWSEGGDKIYLRYDRPVDPSSLANSLKAIGVNTTQVQPFGRADENTYEVTLVGLDTEIRRALDAAPRRRRGGRHPAGRVGRRQGRQAAAVRRRSSRCSTRSC